METHTTLSPLDRLKIAFQADGSFSSRKESYNGSNTGAVAIRFSLKKQRKKDRLKDILSNLDYEHSWSEYDNGYCSVRVKIPVNTFNEFSKELRVSFPHPMTRIFASAFISELRHWDGSKSQKRPNNISYSSTVEDNILFLQGVADAAGYTATYNKYIDKRVDYKRKPIYSTNINLNGGKEND